MKKPIYLIDEPDEDFLPDSSDFDDYLIDFDEEDEEDEPDCRFCNATGEGQTPDTRCPYCNGRGTIKRKH